MYYYTYRNIRYTVFKLVFANFNTMMFKFGPRIIRSNEILNCHQTVVRFSKFCKILQNI